MLPKEEREADDPASRPRSLRARASASVSRPFASQASIKFTVSPPPDSFHESPALRKHEISGELDNTMYRLEIY